MHHPFGPITLPDRRKSKGLCASELIQFRIDCRQFNAARRLQLYRFLRVVWGAESNVLKQAKRLPSRPADGMNAIP
jgi:hypothetical protein